MSGKTYYGSEVQKEKEKGKKTKKDGRRKKKETICNETRAVRRDYGIVMRGEERRHGREKESEREDERHLSKFYGASSGRGYALYFFKYKARGIGPFGIAS